MDAAADAVQDAFVQAHRHWSRVATYNDPGAWLRRVAVNRALNERRRRARCSAVVQVRPSDHEASDGMAVSIDLAAEVAAALDLSTETVKSQLHDARRSLLARLEETPSGS